MAKKAETKKTESLKEKREKLKDSTKKGGKTTSPTPEASTPTTKWDPETKKRVKQVARDEIEEADRKKPKVLTAKTPEKGGASTPIGVDMFTTSLPTGMPAQSFSRSAAPKPFDVQFRSDGKLYVYGPVWNTYEIKIGSAEGPVANKGQWNSVGVPNTGGTLYAVQEDTIEDGEVKSSAHFLAFTVGSDTSTKKYTEVMVAKKFDSLGWRPLASGALFTVGGTGGSVVADAPLAWTVQKRKGPATGSEAKETWQIFSPAWVDGSTTKLPGTAKMGEWASLEVSSGTVYAVYKETSTKPGEGESEEDVTWSFAELTISGTAGTNKAPTAPSGGTGSATPGSAGERYINVPIGAFDGDDFTQYHEGVIVTRYPGGGSSGGGSSWGWGPVEWDGDNQRFVQYKGTFDEDGDFTPVGSPEVVFKVKSHRDDHTQGII